MDNQKLAKIIVPTVTQAVSSLVLAVAIEVLVFQSLVLSKLLQNSQVLPYVGVTGHEALTQLGQYPITRIVAQVLFWSIVGICAYIVYLAVVNTVVELRNEATIDIEYANKGRLAHWASTAGVQIGFATVLILALWLTSLFGLPEWFNLMTQLVVGGYSPLHLLAALSSVVGLTANVYLLWAIAKAAVTINS